MKIFDVRIDGYTKKQLTNHVGNCFGGSKAIKVSKINTEFLLRALNDGSFLKILNSSDLNIVDGRGVLWTARYLTLPLRAGYFLRGIECVLQMIYSGASIVLYPRFIRKPISETIPGVEAFKLMIKSAQDNQASVYLFGGSEDILKSSVARLKKEFPDLKIAGTLNGYSYQTNNKIDVAAEINKTDAKLLIVALGSPKQEIWINDNIGKLKNIRVAVGEGGTLDRIANPSQKAPKCINKIGVEWLWRMFFNKNKSNAKSRFKRVWNAVPVYIYQTVKWKIQHGQAKI